MSSYFDDVDREVHDLFSLDQDMTTFWQRYHTIENRLIADALGATRARRFPRELADRISLIVRRRRVFATSKSKDLHERNAADLLEMRMSFLSSDLHSAFHDVARYGQQHKIRWLMDSPAWMAKRAPKAAV